MGLFGGFKAKFTKNSSSKSKQQEVVCLRYHIHSEFDADNRETVSQINNGFKKTEVERSHLKNKKRNAATKSAVFTENDTSLSQLSNSTPQKSLSLSNLSNPISTSGIIEENQNVKLTDPIIVSNTFSAPSNKETVAVSYTEFRKTSEDNTLVTQKVAVISNNHNYTPDKKNVDYTHSVVEENSNFYEGVFSKNGPYMSHREMSYLQQSTNENSAKENGLNDQSTLIFMTQHSSQSSSSDQNIENDEVDFINSGRSINNTRVENLPVLTDENEYFKVNVIKHDLNISYASSEDEQSHLEEPRHFSRMGYSSQAASIFFGEGDETEVVRPRKIKLTNDDNEDERRSSGAEC